MRSMSFRPTRASISGRAARISSWFRCTMQPATTSLRQRPVFLNSAISRIVSIDSRRAGSMKVQVLTTITSASAGSRVRSYPPRRSVPSMTSLSTRFFGQPRLTIPTLINAASFSGIETVESARVGDRLAQVVDAGNPRDEPPDPNAEAGVRHGAVLADVEIPAERLEGEAVLLDPPEEEIVVVDALAAADDLAVPLGRQDVDAQGAVRCPRIRLHVEGLDRRRVVGDHQRTLQLFREDGLVESAETVAADERRRVLLPRARLHVRPQKEGRRLVIRHPGERLPDGLEPGRVALEGLELGAAAVPGPRQEGDDDVLRQVEKIRELRVRPLRLHHPELGEVPARLRLLGAEGRSEAIDAAKRHRRRLQVELSGLAQVRLLVEVIGLEQRGRALAGRRCQDRRVDQHEVALMEEIADRLGDLAPEPQECMLLRGAQPEVAVVEEKVGAVLLRADRIVVRQLVNHDRPELHLVAPRGAIVLADDSGHLQRRFLRHFLAGLEDRGADLRLEGHRLRVPGPVTDDQEGQLALLPLVVQPAADAHLLAVVGADGPDGRRLHERSGERREI